MPNLDITVMVMDILDTPMPLDIVLMDPVSLDTLVPLPLSPTEAPKV